MTERDLRLLSLVLELFFTKTQRLNTCELTAFFRAEPTVRWPPKDGQPAPTLQETMARCRGFAGRQRTDGPRRRRNECAVQRTEATSQPRQQRLDKSRLCATRFASEFCEV
jgi:hypothetical protein